MNSLRQKLAARTAPAQAAAPEAVVANGLELERTQDTFNPYTRVPTEHASSAKRDLRKLSEWIKMMKALEERKKRGV